MRITFILPFVNVGGGVRVVFEHARGLQKLGHTVSIIYPGPDGVARKYNEPERMLRAGKYAFDRLCQQSEYAWFGHALPVKRVPDLRANHIPDGDIVIATSNETADWVTQYPPRCGLGAYFIQDYETWSREKELVDKTWKYPLARLTISKWLYELGTEHFKLKMYPPIPNGITTELFYPDPNAVPSERLIDIMMIYREAPQKGCARGIEILQRIKKSYPETRFLFFGRDVAPPTILALGTYQINPAQEEIRKLYSQARIFFLPSFQEGFALPRMEATACGCAVVSTDVGGPTDFFISNQNCWLATPNNSLELENKLLEALANQVTCNKYAENAQRNLQHYTWEASTAMLEKTLQTILRNA